MSPPEKEVGPPKGPNGRSGHHTTPTSTEYIAGLRRRRAASRRLPVLPCGHSDPWVCGTCYPNLYPLTEALVEKREESMVSAIKALFDAGVLPVINVDDARSLWRRGGRARALMQDLHELGGIAS